MRQLEIRKAEFYVRNGQKSEAKLIIEKLLLEEDLSSGINKLARK